MIFYGASGHAKVVIEAWKDSGGVVNKIIDDDATIASLLNMQVVSNYKLSEFENIEWIISIGSNRIRKKIAERLKVIYGIVIHSSSCISSSASVGVGSVILANTVINASSFVGKHCIVNTGANIDHDCLISDYVHIAPRATLCGGVEVGEGTLVGAGAIVTPLVKIGKHCILGAGAVVIKDVPDFACVVGNPARIIKIISE